MRAETDCWIACEALEAEVLEAEGQEAAAKVRGWAAQHFSRYHFPSTACEECGWLGMCPSVKGIKSPNSMGFRAVRVSMGFVSIR